MQFGSDAALLEDTCNLESPFFQGGGMPRIPAKLEPDIAARPPFQYLRTLLRQNSLREDSESFAIFRYWKGVLLVLQYLLAPIWLVAKLLQQDPVNDLH